MADANPTLALLLDGPMQSWGHASRFGRRTTLHFPTRSGILGLLCAAMGVARTDREGLRSLGQLNIEVSAFPREGQTIQRLTDFHTVGGGYDLKRERQCIPRKANQGAPGTVLTHREYLLDARFGVLISAERQLLQRLHDALLDPVWGLWLGRKSCIPSDRICQGLHATVASARRHLADHLGVSPVRRVCEVERFEDGTDTINDVPLDFATREFSARRIFDEPLDEDG